MGGHIELESELGKGSQFHFNLRFEKSAQIAQTRRTDSIEVDFTGIRALVIGDGEISRGVIARYLAAWGIESLSLASEEAALNELRSGLQRNLAYAVVLLDRGPDNQG